MLSSLGHAGRLPFSRRGSALVALGACHLQGRCHHRLEAHSYPASQGALNSSTVRGGSRTWERAPGSRPPQGQTRGVSVEKVQAFELPALVIFLNF